MFRVTYDTISGTRVKFFEDEEKAFAFTDKIDKALEKHTGYYGGYILTKL